MVNKIYADLENLGSAERYLDEILEILYQIRLFDDFSLDEIKVLCHYLHCYAAPRNYLLLEEGRDGDFLLLLLTGAAEVRRYVPGVGHEKIADILPGATVGETAVIDGRPRFISCVATAPADVAVLTRDALNSLLLQAPRLGNKLLLALLHMLSGHLREAFNREMSGAVA